MRELEALYRRIVDELWRRGDPSAVDRYFTEDYAGHDPLFPRRGRQQLREVVQRYRSAITGLRYEVHDVLVDGDRVAARWTVTGRHTGPLFGIAGTGRPLEVNGMSINRFRDGQIAEAWLFNDTLSLLRQLDQPTPGTA
jgi:steroid delta-isomerase-like uncharacterized protein